MDMVLDVVRVKCELITAPLSPYSGYFPSFSSVPLWYQKMICGGSGV